MPHERLGRHRGRHSAGSTTQAAAICSSRRALRAAGTRTTTRSPFQRHCRELVQGRRARFPLDLRRPCHRRRPRASADFARRIGGYGTGRKRSRRRWTQASWRCATGCASRILPRSAVYADAPEEHRRAVHRALAEVVEDAEQRAWHCACHRAAGRRRRRDARLGRGARPPAARLRRRPSSPNTRAVLHQPTDQARARRPQRGDARGAARRQARSRQMLAELIERCPHQRRGCARRSSRQDHRRHSRDDRQRICARRRGGRSRLQAGRS